MTNREKLQHMTDRELADFLCGIVEDMVDKTDIDTCDICPVRNLCGKGHNGFIDWFNKEVER